MTDSPFWNDDWMKIQQKYWDNWSDMSRKAMGMDRPAKSPWESAMDHWWQAVSPSVPDTGSDFMRRMMDQGKQFFRMSDEFGKNYQASNDWLEAVNKTFSDMQQMFAGGMEQAANLAGSGAEEPLHKLMAFWEMPLDNWQRMASSLAPMPGDLLRNMPRSGQLDALFSAPGLGYTREEEGQYKELMQRGLAYQQALGEYSQFFSNLGMASVERMRGKVQALLESGKAIDSARGLYDLWVAACEEVYAEQVMTPEYAKIHGGLVNALMALKQKMGQMADENLGALNMPTRRELRTLQQRLQESRREIKGLRAQMDVLQEQVQQLRAIQVQAANAAPAQAQAQTGSGTESSAPAAASSVKPKPARKKASTRRSADSAE
ncbi:MAG: class III poly(R)-hydroxyalkanoic acid synthase subunit PhaE [Gammaproteobacteria bacterium SHHR-1]|uniref:class III poly(R)-hydroxyalkanoic acid synthase subunit PhaE n=1 Tax=Magnetovirga frankeli TaxID=947516 RepID=UPI0012939A64|nr:class III poly(R)-hydroxyalkanoic acid synthase subunit PhaE [gamma proteobacterium SS-5]